MCKSAIYTANTSPVTLNLTVQQPSAALSLGTVIRRFGHNIQLSGSRKKTAILHSPEAILEAITKSDELQADSDVTLIAAANRKKADKAYSKAKAQGFDEIIKIGL